MSIVLIHNQTYTLTMEKIMKKIFYGLAALLVLCALTIAPVAAQSNTGVDVGGHQHVSANWQTVPNSGQIISTDSYFFYHHHHHGHHYSQSLY